MKYRPPRCPECDLKNVHPSERTYEQRINLWLVSDAPCFDYPEGNVRIARKDMDEDIMQRDPLTFCHTCGTPDNPRRSRWQASQRPAIIAQAQEAKR